jgi:hypothetical protein
MVRKHTGLACPHALPHKEQEIGQHCCQSEESHSNPDLTLLKEALGLDEQQWHAYKTKVRFILHAATGRAPRLPESPG